MIAASSSATARGLAARGVQPVYDTGFISLEERRRRIANSAQWTAALRERQNRIAIARLIRERAKAHEVDGLTFSKLLKRFVGIHGVTAENIFGRSMEPKVVLVRSAVAYWARRRLGLSFRGISMRLDNRDHSTVQSLVRYYPKRRALMGRKVRALSERSS